MSSETMFDKLSLADYLKISTRTLDRLKANGQIPAPDLVLKGPRWSRETIQAWLRTKPVLSGRGRG